jgi:4-amino-4-deoxy-L-arabinose transferase-like glycosyltransferase
MTGVNESVILNLKRKDILYLFILSSFFFLFKLGEGSLASFDESFYAIVSRNIFRTGDFVRLQLFGEPFMDKPPLYMWVSALFFKVGGVNEFTIRLFSALSGVGAVLTTYFLGSKLASRQAGFFGACVLMSSRDFLHYSRWGVLDITNLFFFTLAFLFFLKGKENSKFFLVFWIAVACAFLTKGPIIVFGGVILAAYSLIRRDFSYLTHKYFWLGLILGLMIVLPWHILFYLDDPERFMKGYFHFNYIARVESSLDGHVGGPFFYLKILIQKFRPWVIFLFPAIAYSLFLSFKSAQKHSFRFLLLWIFFFLAFFSFAVKTKLAWYILPIYPAISIAIGVLIARFLAEKYHWIAKPIFLAVLILHIPTSDYVKNHSPKIKELSSVIQANVREGDSVFLYRFYEQPATAFYWERSIKYIESLNELKVHFKNFPCSTIGILENDYLTFKDILRAEGYEEIAKASAGDKTLILMKNNCLSVGAKETVELS